MNLRKVLLSIGLLSAIWLAFFADKSASSGVSEAVSVPKKNRVEFSAKSGPATGESIPLLAIVERSRLIAVDEKMKPSGMFEPQSWNPPPPPVVKAPPPPAPTAPPLPFQFIGKKFEDGVYEVYLANGDKTYAVGVKSVIENTYRVEAIKPPLLTLTYLPLNQSQTLSIGAGN